MNQAISSINAQKDQHGLRNLDPSELASDSPAARAFVPVIDARNNISSNDLVQKFHQHKDQILATYQQSGVVLLRGWPIPDTGIAENLLKDMDFAFDNEYLGGASPRTPLSKHFFTSTEAPAPYVITFHTEMCYLEQRPSKIFFYCIEPPQKYGETPIFDCAAIYQALDPELRDKIESLGMMYQRYFVEQPAKLFNVYKTWKDAFNAKNKEEVEAACVKQGMTWQWQNNGGLLTQTKIPGVIQHPTSGEKCLSLTIYNGHAAPYDMKKFRQRINPLARFALSNLVRSQYAKNNVFMRTLWGDGSNISKNETQAIIDTAWQSSTMFHWQKGDLLLIDNIRCGHGRLNVSPPRQIAAALGDPYRLQDL